MKATLINPAIAWDALDASWIRHGLGSISTYAKSRGHEIDLIDLRRMTNDQGIDWQLFDKTIKDSDSNMFGISVLSANFDFAKECIKRIREIKSKAKVAVGGIHVTVEREKSKDLGADYYVWGEGELAFSLILEGELERLNLLDSQKQSNVFHAEPIPDLDLLFFADRDLFAPLRELPIGYLPEPFHTIIIGRGCPYTCTFCYPAERTLFGKKVRMRSVDNVLAELLELKAKYGLKSFLIHDDCFSAFPSYCSEFAEKKQKVLPDATFYCQARADHIVKRPQQFKELYKAGLRGCLIGMESGSNRVLDFLRKGTSVEENIKAAEILSKLNIEVWANLMVGIPTETKAEVIETVQMAQKVKQIQPRAILSWASYTPHPGSDLFEYCKENDLSLIRQASDYRRYFEGRMNPKIKGVDYKFLEWAVTQA